LFQIILKNKKLDFKWLKILHFIFEKIEEKENMLPALGVS
jgi:hypothetical protein